MRLSDLDFDGDVCCAVTYHRVTVGSYFNFSTIAGASVFRLKRLLSGGVLNIGGASFGLLLCRYIGLGSGAAEHSYLLVAEAAGL